MPLSGNRSASRPKDRHSKRHAARISGPHQPGYTSLHGGCRSRLQQGGHCGLHRGQRHAVKRHDPQIDIEAGGRDPRRIDRVPKAASPASSVCSFLANPPQRPIKRPPAAIPAKPAQFGRGQISVSCHQRRGSRPGLPESRRARRKTQTRHRRPAAGLPFCRVRHKRHATRPQGWPQGVLLTSQGREATRREAPPHPQRQWPRQSRGWSARCQR